MGNQDWRHYLNGLYIEVDGTDILAVASDAHRLAIASSDLEAASSKEINGIIPRKSINEIAKLVGDIEGAVEVNLSNSSIKTSTPNASFVSKLIEGKFPDYEQVIPSGDSSVLKVSTKDFSDALTRVSVLSSDKYLSLIHISEPTRRNPISYAGFCWKKKKKKTSTLVTAL